MGVTLVGMESTGISVLDEQPDDALTHLEGMSGLHWHCSALLTARATCARAKAQLRQHRKWSEPPD